MLKKFEIVLKNEKSRIYKMIGWFIIAIHFIIFLYLALFTASKSIRGVSIIILTLITIAFILLFYFRDRKLQTEFHIYFLLLMVGWICMGQYWFALTALIFDMLNSIASRPLVTIYSIEKIRYPSFPAKNILWNELTNTRLKDGLLTIDFKNNRLIQQAEDENKTSVDEKEFNEFCIQQLVK